jgi:hypothetical protein
MPGIHHVKKAANNLNSKLFTIYRNPHGNYVDCGDKITRVIKNKYKNMKDNIKNDTIQIKLCGDGTIVKTRHFLNFCFTLPQEGNIAKTSKGNYILGIFDMQNKKEDYKTVKECLKEISLSLESLRKKGKVEIEGKEFKLKFFLGGDMKFLRLAMGLNACNSNFSCTWCMTHKDQYHLNEKSIIDNNFRKIGNSVIGSDGYINSPIFKFIDFDDVVFDTLHLLLRITEKLLKLFQSDCIIADKGITNNLDKMPHQTRLFNYLQELGIKSPYKVIKSGCI